MWAALFGSLGLSSGGSGSGSGSTGVLILRPDATAMALPIAGFKGGAELRLATDAAAGVTTVAQLLGKLNKYRGPDQQLRRVWSESGEEIVGNTEVHGELRVVVRATSV